MRQSGRILLHCPRDMEREVLTCVLGTRLATRVWAFAKGEDLLQFVKDVGCANDEFRALVLVAHADSDANELDAARTIAGMLEMAPDVPSVLVDVADKMSYLRVSARWKGELTPAQIIEVVRAGWRRRHEPIAGRQAYADVRQQRESPKKAKRECSFQSVTGNGRLPLPTNASGDFIVTEPSS